MHWLRGNCESFRLRRGALADVLDCLALPLGERQRGGLSFSCPIAIGAWVQEPAPEPVRLAAPEAEVFQPVSAATAETLELV